MAWSVLFTNCENYLMSGPLDERELVMLADQHGITVYPLSKFWIEPDQRRGLVLGFAAFGEAEIKAGVQKLADAWKKPHQKAEYSTPAG